MPRSLIALLFAVVMYGAQHKVLVITNSDFTRADMAAFQKGLQDVKKLIHERFPSVEVVTTNVYVDRKKKEDIQKDLARLKDKLQEKYILIVAPGLSKAFGVVAPYLPTDTPIITASSNPKELEKYHGTLFSTASLPRYNKARDLKKLHTLIGFDKIIVVYDDKPGSYPQAIVDAFIQDKPHIKVVSVDIDRVDKRFLDRYANNAMIYISSDGTKSSKILIDRFSFIVSNLEFLYDKKYDVFYYLPYFSTAYRYTNEKKIFTSSAVYSSKKNIFEYEYLQHLPFKKSKFISRYDQAFRWYYPKIMAALHGIKNFDNDTKILRRLIYNNLKKTTIKNPFIDEKTRYIFAFEKEKDGIYFNAIRKYNILNNYLFIVSTGRKLLYPIQNYAGAISRTIYITPQLKKLKVLTLDATKAKVDLIVKIATPDPKIELGKDILIETANKEDLDIKLLSNNKVSRFGTIKLYHKIYSVSLTTNINSKLFRFPYDEQVLNIALYANNFSKNPILLQLLDDKKQYDATVSDNWLVTKHFPTYSRYIYHLGSGLDDKMRIALSDTNYFTIKIKRKDPTQTIAKYFLPAIILLLLALFIGYFIFRRYSENHIGIISDLLLGIISIYFIYSLLIQIERLIFMDIVFYAMIFIVVLLIIAVFIFEKFKMNKI